VLPDTVTLTPQVNHVEGVQINIIDPNEPGSVLGEIVNASDIDSILATVALYATADSTHVRYLTRSDTLGAFAISGVKPGAYRLWAFLDVKRDSVRGEYDCGPGVTCLEPWATLPDSLVVRPGASVHTGKLIIKRREK